MKRVVLKELLLRQDGVKATNRRLDMTSDADVSLYIAMGVEPLVVDRVSALVLEDEIVIATTRREETYACGYEDVRAVRVSSGGRGAGY